MSRALWLPDVVRPVAQRFGVPFHVYPEFPTAGTSDLDAAWQVLHHTASNRRSGPAPSVEMCRKGRPAPNKLDPPLCNGVIGRDASIHLIASGTANHAGSSTSAVYPDGTGGNRRSLGWECENDGLGEPWPSLQYRVMVAVNAAVARHLRWGADRSVGHKEIARPVGRKPDPAGIDMGTFRRDVANDITPPPPPPGDDFLMALSHDDQLAMKQQLGELYLHVVGPDVPQWGEGNPRHNSVVTRLRYLFGESLGGDNLGEFRALLDNAVGNAQGIDDLLAKVEALETEIAALRDAQAPPA